jgi:hypothetical protein
MPERDDHTWRMSDEDPEPDWAELIRAGRRARGDKLRDVFETFDEEDPDAPLPAPTPPKRSPHRRSDGSPAGGEGPYDQDLEPPS